MDIVVLIQYLGEVVDITSVFFDELYVLLSGVEEVLVKGGFGFGFSSAAIHHSGFTGQFLCVDPELPFAGVVLTLRCPGAEGTLTARRRLLSLYAGGK